MKFSEVIELLRATGNDPVVLTGRRKKPAVLVAPSLAGRVMATTYSGEQGKINGFVDARAFKDGMRDIWDNWGGEERYWLCPEGGQFGLMFDGKANSFSNYTVQPGINKQRYTVIDQAGTGDSVTIQASFELINAANTKFSAQCTRRITALDDCPYALGTSKAVQSVGFESSSTIVNSGTNAWTKESGCLAHWHLGQFLPGEHVVVIVPFRQSFVSDPPVREDYFRDFCIDGKMRSDCYWIRDGFVLLRADGKCRTKIGQNRSRATGLLGSYNLENDEMILLDYDFYSHLEYAASYWYEQAEPFHGDCISVSAEGPSESGGGDGRCYELEAMSPAMLLAPGQSFTFRTRTMHIRGPRREMATICRRELGPDISTLVAFTREVS